MTEHDRAVDDTEALSVPFVPLCSKVSVVVASHNQRERLRLVLVGLSVQSVPKEAYEVIVVDDGSNDGTEGMVSEEDWNGMELRLVRLRRNVGRCRARNAGADAARGGYLAFLDGDALPHPKWLEAYLEALEGMGGNPALGCGGIWVLPKLEFLLDPERSGSIVESCPSVLREYMRHHEDRILVSADMVRDRFGGIEGMAEEGGYPGGGDLSRESDGLLSRGASGVPWMAVYPHNMVVSRKHFLSVGGFDDEIGFSEGWELGYRLAEVGVLPTSVPRARSYHLYHYHGFADPEVAQQEMARRVRAVKYMAKKHEEPRFTLLIFWLASVFPDILFPEEMTIRSLIELDERWLSLSVEEVSEYRLVADLHPVYQ